MWVSILVPLSCLTLLVRRRDTRPPAETIAVVCLMLVAGLRVSRVAPLICIPALALLGPWIVKGWGHIGTLKAPSRAAAGVLFVPAALSMFAAWQPVSHSLSCVAINDAWAPDTEAAASVVGASGRLWTTFDWGEPAIWHFGPALRVSIDGRRETWYFGHRRGMAPGRGKGRSSWIGAVVGARPRGRVAARDAPEDPRRFGDTRLQDRRRDADLLRSRCDRTSATTRRQTTARRVLSVSEDGGPADAFLSPPGPLSRTGHEVPYVLGVGPKGPCRRANSDAGQVRRGFAGGLPGVPRYTRRLA